MDSQYEAPESLQKYGGYLVNGVLGREAGIVKVAFGDNKDIRNYAVPLALYGSFFFFFALIWFIVLWALKCNCCAGRKKVGCAAGFAFHDTNSPTYEGEQVDEEDDEEEEEDEEEDGEKVEAGDEDEESVDVEDGENNVENKSAGTEISQSEEAEAATEGFDDEPADGESGDEAVEEDEAGDDEEVSKDGNDTDSETSDKETATKSGTNGDVFEDEEKERKLGNCCTKKGWASFFNSMRLCFGSARPKDVRNRKYATRFVFICFANVTLLCCALALGKIYAPLEAMSLTAGTVLDETKAMFSQAKDSFMLFQNATRDLETQIFFQIEELPMSSVCPSIPRTQFEDMAGFNMDSISLKIFQDFYDNQDMIISSRDAARNGVDAIAILRDANSIILTSTDNKWILSLLISFMILIVMSQMALVCHAVYKELTGSQIKSIVGRLECCYAWTILPLQIIIVIIFWILIIAFCFGTVITTDTCLPAVTLPASNGTEAMTVTGTPDDTIMAVFEESVFDNTADNSAVKEIMKQFLTGCKEDPLGAAFDARALLQTTVGYFDSQMKQLEDSKGMFDSCGPDQRMDEYVENMVGMRANFAELYDSIGGIYESMSCPRVNYVYVETIHGSVCTDLASASADGFVLMIFLSICGMVLITLRSAWRVSV